ncbi:ABC transporter ATP-binding protein [Sporomusa sp.]|jgi:ABC-type nitrate/sulfonate/bicarbonate transport system ATPase subunit|uniref:ABC transporter ATP-binding protein n=1 Tax=Sporomusa sp. TaxID=2078658 RepID=UPI002BC57AEF|nr:ABC transporter ATP-binding protein [Sporomusa sp.]MDF2874415.1 ssuB 6 [Sporomusa sp.]HWR07883.1 ABC transporter ATP-binding protein [Sporomusa sp.]
MTEKAQDKLIIEGVSKTFTGKERQVTALAEASFTVKPSEFVTILGPSGCGKSTILKIVAGLESPTSGRVLLNGREITEPGRDRGMVFQTYTLFPWLSVRENIEFGLDVAGKTKQERQEVSEHYIEKIGLRGFESFFPRDLSGGMKQRVAIARALANDPEVLLMDEPFGALDAQTRTVMQELLLDVWDESHKTILFVTHDVDEAVFIGDTIYVMTARPGRIKARIEVDLPNQRTFDLKLSEEFTQIKRQVMGLIREEAWKAANTNT